MLNKLRLIILTILSAFSLLLAMPSLTASAIDCSSSNLSAKDALLCGTNNGQVPAPGKATNTFNNVVSDMLNILSVLAGITAVVMIITGGFRFITSGGNPENVKKARSALMYAVIGIVIVALAQIIVQFVLAKAANP